MAKNNLKQQAYSQIKEKIIRCEYTPGMLLNEEILCEEVNVSRTPIRDALSRLEQEGLITIMPKRGIMVSKLSIKDINMIFELRLLLEPYALEHYGNSLDDSQLLEYYRKFSEPVDDEKINEFYELDDEFHMWIINSVPNIYFQKNYEVIHNQNIRFRIMTGQRSSRRLEDTQKEHVAIVKACIGKDWSKATEALRQHLLNSKTCTFDLLLNRQTLP